MLLKHKCSLYDTAFKDLAFAEANNNCAAQREFGVIEKLVCDWGNKKEQLVSCMKTVKKIRCTSSQYAELETDLNI